MRRVVGAVFVTLDGVIQGPGGPDEDRSDDFPYCGWLPPLGDEALDAQVGALFSRPFDLLLGRRTYDIFAGFWPDAPDDMAAIRQPFNACTKHVFTRSDAPLEWENSRRIDLPTLRALKQEDGPDLVIQGSSTLYPQLLAADLLDELTLMISPLVLGAGKRLFGIGTPPRTLRMTGHTVSAGGNIIATYVPAGPVEIGTYVTTPPSEREQARRRAIAENRW